MNKLALYRLWIISGYQYLCRYILHYIIPGHGVSCSLPSGVCIHFKKLCICIYIFILYRFNSRWLLFDLLMGNMHINVLSWVLQTCSQSVTTVLMSTTENREEGRYDLTTYSYTYSNTDLSKSQTCFSQITQHSVCTSQQA